jgi:hypothetical protein
VSSYFGDEDLIVRFSQVDHEEDAHDRSIESDLWYQIKREIQRATVVIGLGGHTVLYLSGRLERSGRALGIF